MPYRLMPHDTSLQHMLRRIALEDLGAALATLETPRLVAPSGIHDIRKRIKKLRALLRLVRPGFPDFAQENAALRMAGQSLASRRDADVRLATYDALFGAHAGLAPLRARLVADGSDATDMPADAGLILGALRHRAQHWHLTGRDRDILTKALTQTRRNAQKTMAVATKSRSVQAMHDWRKCAKTHWYQARLLSPIWPEAMAPVIATAERLTEDLGDHHDLAVLADYAAALPKGLIDKPAAAHFTQVIDAARTALETRIFPDGHRQFAGDPQAMARLWVRWWRLWQDQAASAPDSPLSISATVSSTP